MNIDVSKVAVVPTRVLTVPNEGGIALKLVLDFSVAQLYSLDLKPYVDQNKISMIQGIKIDASQTNVPVSVTSIGSGDNITLKGGKQGFFTFLCPNPPVITFAAATGVVTFFLYNTPIAGHSWDSV